MSDKFKLYKNIENFIDNNCLYKKNEPFIITFCNEKEGSDVLPVVRDNSHFIQCIMNIPKEKENVLKEAQNKGGIKVNIIDSSFEFILYKNNASPSVIKCLLLLIINDIEKTESQEEENTSDKNCSDINSEYKLLEKLKKFIFNYIRQNKKNKNNNNNTPGDNASTNNVLETILLGGAKNGIRFFNHDNNGINYEEENIKKIIEIIKNISSKLEIKQKKTENEKSENKTNEGEAKEANKKRKKANDNDINEVLDELNPDYKNELIYRYLDEMPEEIVNLMKKYKNISFTKNMYMEYIDNKNKPGEIEEKNEYEVLKEKEFEDN
jgi:hypothetical protein